MTAAAYNPRLTAYFGDSVLQAGFQPVPHVFLRHYAALGLSGQQAMFIVQVMATTWDLGCPPTTLSQIAARMGIARRTAQALGAELRAKGLVSIYEQYDDDGAQIENMYDLGPLFQRLAGIESAAVPASTQRPRQARSGPAAVEPDHRATDVPSAPALAVFDTAPWQDATQPPGSNAHPPLDQTLQLPQQNPARLKEESKNLQKNQPRRGQQQAAAVGLHTGWTDRKKGSAEEAGRSLRRDTTLTSVDVHQSRQILARIGLNADAADAAASTLHPSEAWALWLHARASGLRPAWVASQVFDPKRRVPRMAGVPAPCEAVGHLLAALPMEAAEAVLEVSDRHAPADRDIAQAHLVSDPRWSLPGNDLSVFEAVWHVVAETRHGRHRLVQQPALVSTTHEIKTLDQRDARWQTARAALKAALPREEYATWVEPLVLVHTERDLVVVGAPNIFVRRELQTSYVSDLQAAVTHAWGQTMQIEVVIDLALAG